MQLEQNLDLYVEPYTFDVTKRQNFCGLQAKVDADEVDLRSILSGKYLNIAIMPGKCGETSTNNSQKYSFIMLCTHCNFWFHSQMM